ncbi:MAG TPA: glycosyltransferase [Candidatus Bathyarchaeia archaeon]|nr:glycosyltransferase [Candidatus Bathyarchaeia archaeon]
MKIVQAVGWYFPESWGGTEVYVAGLCRRLRAAGQEVLVAAPDPAHAVERTYEHDGVPVFRYPIPAAPTRDEVQGRVRVRGAERFHRWLADQRPDVVHAHTFVTGLGLHELQAARAAGARVVATTHSASLGWICQRGTMMQWGRWPCDGVCRPARCAACALEARGVPRPVASVLGAVPPGLGRGARRLPGRLGTALGMSDLIARNQRMQAEMLATVDRFVLLTGGALEAVAANGAPRAKLALNRLGLSHGKVVAKPGPDERPTGCPITVGYLGRYDAIKGVHDLARAAASLPPALGLRVEFRGPVRSAAERTVRDELRAIAGHHPRVTFADAVPAPEVPGVLAGWDVLCCPSVCAEGGPTVAIEAHAAGTPVIGTRIGGLAELVADGVNGALVPPADWRGLAALLRALGHDGAATIDGWRRRLPAARTMDEIAAEHLSVYAS